MSLINHEYGLVSLKGNFLRYRNSIIALLGVKVAYFKRYHFSFREVMNVFLVAFSQLALVMEGLRTHPFKFKEASQKGCVSWGASTHLTISDYYFFL